MKIQDIYYINGVQYQKLESTEREIIDRASEKIILWDLEDLILTSFPNCVINLITTNPRYAFIIQSEFPQDLTGKLVTAYTQSKG